MNYLVDAESPVEEFLGIGKKAKAYKLQKRRDRQKAREDIAALGSGLIPLDENGKPRYALANPTPAQAPQQDSNTVTTNMPTQAGFKAMDNIPGNIQSSGGGGSNYTPTEEPTYPGQSQSESPDTGVDVKVSAPAKKTDNKTMLYVGIGVAVVVVLLIVLKKKA